MTDPRLAVIVDADAFELRKTKNALEAVGFVVMASTSFVDARALLAAVTPEIVVADIKLEAYNGLHLAALCAIRGPRTSFIATHDTYDAVLERDAARLSAVYVVKTSARDEVTRAALTMLNTRAHGVRGVRQSYRKPAPSETVAKVSTLSAHVVDVSYGGVQFKLRTSVSGVPEDVPPDVFDIDFPDMALSLHATRIWTNPDDAAEGCRCGADISQNEPNKLERWREFVDSVV